MSTSNPRTRQAVVGAMPTVITSQVVPTGEMSTAPQTSSSDSQTSVAAPPVVGGASQQDLDQGSGETMASASSSASALAPRTVEQARPDQVHQAKRARKNTDRMMMQQCLECNKERGTSLKGWTRLCRCRDNGVLDKLREAYKMIYKVTLELSNCGNSGRCTYRGPIICNHCCDTFVRIYDRRIANAIPVRYGDTTASVGASATQGISAIGSNAHLSSSARTDQQRPKRLKLGMYHDQHINWMFDTETWNQLAGLCNVRDGQRLFEFLAENMPDQVMAAAAHIIANDVTELAKDESCLLRAERENRRATSTAQGTQTQAASTVSGTPLSSSAQPVSAAEAIASNQPAVSGDAISASAAAPAASQEDQVPLPSANEAVIDVEAARQEAAERLPHLRTALRASVFGRRSNKGTMGEAKKEQFINNMLLFIAFSRSMNMSLFAKWLSAALHGAGATEYVIDNLARLGICCGSTTMRHMLAGMGEVPRSLLAEMVKLPSQDEQAANADTSPDEQQQQPGSHVQHSAAIQAAAAPPPQVHSHSESVSAAHGQSTTSSTAPAGSTSSS